MANIYDPKSSTPFKLSRSKLELFIDCPRCFYLDRRMGISRPSFPPFTLNSAVDTLLKKEFDIHRAKNIIHPLMVKYGIDAVPVNHEKLSQWRHNFTGIQYLHSATKLIIFGAIDDLWQNKAGEYIVVDYKATAKAEVVTELNTVWHEAYKRQMEIYQWLLDKNGFKVSSLGYFVYCTGRTDKEAFDKKLEFEVVIIPYEGKRQWVESSIKAAHKCLQQAKAPLAKKTCEYCGYISRAKKIK